MLVSLQQDIWGIDDWCVVGAWVFAMPVTVGQAVCGGLGFGRDTWAVEAKKIYLIMKVSYAPRCCEDFEPDQTWSRTFANTLVVQIVYFNQLSYFLSATLSKLCFLFMFLRIFPAERIRKLVFAGIILSLLFPIAFGLPMTFACRPISGTYVDENNSGYLLKLPRRCMDILGQRNTL
jgi:hypothetical protein